MSFSGRCYRCEDKCNISAALHLSHLLFQVISEEGAGINMQLQAVTGRGEGAQANQKACCEF